jgi:hypothetical protein
VTVTGGGTVVATSHHPFWDASTGRFTYADALRPGDKLREASGHLVRVLRTRIYAARVTAYNLTVSGIHTYYVLAGSASILVHNSCDPDNLPAKPAKPAVTRLKKIVCAGVTVIALFHGGGSPGQQLPDLLQNGPGITTAQSVRSKLPQGPVDTTESGAGGCPPDE